ncbi:MAG: sucrase ferredoxin [Actinomycetota bacterium]|nr:sucrase ferredoxin [Actinomycetota bacterium]
MIDAAMLGCSTGEARCATWSRAAGLDPIGTTGSHQGYLLADVGLPWPADIGVLEEVVAAHEVLSGTGIRFQATVPVGDRRVVLYRRPAAAPHQPPAAPDLVRTETTVDPPAGAGDEHRLAAAAERLLAAPVTVGSGQRREVLVCTHGRRDVCCGARGSRLHQELVAGPDLLGAPVDIRRTSHTGGHRFAPTAIILPEATAWAYADVDLLRAVVTRTGPVTAVLGHYRGWAGLGSPRLQALERAVVAKVGWDLFDRPRWGEEHDRIARLHVGGDTRAAVWEATVAAGRRVPRPECGEAVSATGKADTELVVNDLRRVT